MADGQERLAMEMEIKEIVGGPVVRSMNGMADGEIYLASSWLLAIHSYVRRQQGDTAHVQRVGRDQEQLLVAIANRLGLDVAELLEAEPIEEVRIVRDALVDCERSE